MKVLANTLKVKRRTWAVILMAFALLALAVSPLSLEKRGYVDFPCEWTRPNSTIMTKMTDQTRLAFCVSVYPRDMEGGAPYADGATDQDSIAIPARTRWYGEYRLERQGQALRVNGKPLAPADPIVEYRWFPSLNPWIMDTAIITLRNTTSGDPATAQLFFVSGSIREGFGPNPIGLVILLLGIGLFVWARRS